MQISFYVLSEDKAQDFLGFVCQLTQTALNKSTQSLLILIENEVLIGELDEALWSNDASSFIPHQRLKTQQTADVTSDSVLINIATSKHQSFAPVLLSTFMPADFNGIILNTTAHPVNSFMAATNNAAPTRVLEIIKPDSVSMQQGRDKYKQYQQLNYELTHFKV